MSIFHPCVFVHGEASTNASDYRIGLDYCILNATLSQLCMHMRNPN